LPYIWVAQCLNQTIQNLIKNKASMGKQTLTTKVLPKEDLHPHLRKCPTNNPTLKHPTQHQATHIACFLTK